MIVPAAAWGFRRAQRHGFSKPWTAQPSAKIASQPDGIGYPPPARGAYLRRRKAGRPARRRPGRPACGRSGRTRRPRDGPLERRRGDARGQHRDDDVGAVLHEASRCSPRGRDDGRDRAEHLEGGAAGRVRVDVANDLRRAVDLASVIEGPPMLNTMPRRSAAPRGAATRWRPRPRPPRATRPAPCRCR